MKKFLILFLILLIFKQALAQEIIISEIMYNPKGSDTDREWIEIVNLSNNSLKIFGGKKGWRLNDGKNHLFEETEIILNPKEVLVIVQNKKIFLNEYPEFNVKIIEANFSLKNDSGSISLIDENKIVRASINYSKNCGGYGNDRSIIFVNNSCYENAKLKGNPGKWPDEIYRKENQTINETTTFTLTSTQSTNSQSTTTQSTSSQKETSPLTFEEKIITTTIEKKIDYSFLVINEFFPNPKGNDKGKEFIELFNEGDEDIDLEGLILQVGRYKIKLSGKIGKKEYLVLTNEDYNFFIKNSGDEIKLLDSKGNLIHKISYQGKAKEGLSFSRVEEEWIWTIPTPGKENSKQEINFEKENPTKKEIVKENKNIDEDNERYLAQIIGNKEDNQKNLFLIIGSFFFLIILVILFFVIKI
ncbi:MAG: hypothetical protein C4348_01250 [Patescibacteria group bacterium]